MNEVGAGAPTKRRPPKGSVVTGCVVLTMALALSSCGSSSQAPSAAGGTTAPSAAATRKGTALEAFPTGTTYWRGVTGAPVVAHSDNDNLCFFYWVGLGGMPVYTGGVTELVNQWNWVGVEGRFPFQGAPASQTAASMTFTPAPDGSAGWYVDSVFGFNPGPITKGSADPGSGNDLWTPSSAEQASSDFVTFLGLQPGEQFEAPTLTSCPGSADFT